MTFTYAYILPISVGICFPVTFIVIYILAVIRNDVTPIFPYISDTGNWSPESCIFGFMLNVGSILMVSCMYIRYRLIRDVCEKNDIHHFVKKWNNITWCLAIAAVLGIILVAHFQETNCLVVHLIGAILCFGLGFVYQGIQTRISFILFPIIGNRTINVLRVILSVISCITFNLTFATAGLALMQFRGKDVTKWTKGDGGFTYHLISTINEWILAFSTMIYILTFTFEFRPLKFSEPEISYKN